MEISLAGRIKRKIRISIAYAIVNIQRFLAEKSRRGNNKLEEDFIRDGFVKFSSEKTNGLSDYFVPILEAFDETGACPDDVFLKKWKTRDYGTKTVAVDVNSPFLFKYIFNKELYDLIYSYYGKPFYLRNNPVIQYGYAEDPAYAAQVMHCDWGLRQLTLMVSLTDLEESNMHMEFLAGSHKKYYFKTPGVTDAFLKEVDDYREAHPDCLLTTCGKKDTLSLFDAGNGYHRQVPGERRIMVHMNFVDNLSVTHWDKNWDPEGDYDYFFSRRTPQLEKMIRESGIPESFFSLVLQKMSPGVGVPRLLAAAAA